MSTLVTALEEFIKSRNENQEGAQNSTEEVTNKEGHNNFIKNMAKLDNELHKSYYNKLYCKGFLC